MKNDWEILELQEVSNVIDSLHQTPGFAVSGYPMVRAADVKGGFLDFNHSPLVSEEDYLQFIRNHKPQKGDIVISRVGSFFNFSYVNFNHDFCIGQNTSIIVPTINSRFLYYILLSPFVQAQIEKSLVGTSQKTLSLKHIRELKIPTPQLNQQRAIADVLSAFDDKIELNRKMNHTLDKLGQTIFNHFFVDNPDTNKWITKDLSEICSTQYGFTASTLREKEGPRFLRITDMNKDPWITWSQVPFCKISESEFQKYKLSFGDILVSRMADPGKAAIMESDIDSVFASYLVRLIMNNPHYAYFTFYYLRSSKYLEYSNGAKSGSVQSGMNAKVITAAKLKIPPEDLAIEFEKQIIPIRKKINSNLDESSTLAELRDTLLPKLMSGQVRVSPSVIANPGDFSG